MAATLLVLAMIWGLYDETYTIRPWKSYQSRFVKLYSRFLAQASLGQAEVERQIKASPDYEKLDTAMQQAERAALPAATAIDRRINDELVPKILALNEPFQEIRSQVAALTYQIETSPSEALAKSALRARIEQLKSEKHFQSLSDQLESLKDEKSRLLQERVDLHAAGQHSPRPARPLPSPTRIPGASTATISALRASLSKVDTGVRQIHVQEADLVDRCESCHPRRARAESR